MEMSGELEHLAVTLVEDSSLMEAKSDSSIWFAMSVCMMSVEIAKNKFIISLQQMDDAWMITSPNAVDGRNIYIDNFNFSIVGMN